MILIGLGSNLSFCGRPPASLLHRAMQALSPMGEGGQVSGLYESLAWPDPTDPPYLNAVMRLESTAYSPEKLMAALQATEDAFGRERAWRTGQGKRYAPRTLDLDLLDYHGQIFTKEELCLPHPGIVQRDFVLCPLMDIAPDWVHPLENRTAAQLFSTLRASDAVLSAKRLETKVDF